MEFSMKKILLAAYFLLIAFCALSANHNPNHHIPQYSLFLSCNNSQDSLRPDQKSAPLQIGQLETSSSPFFTYNQPICKSNANIPSHIQSQQRTIALIKALPSNILLHLCNQQHPLELFTQFHLYADERYVAYLQTRPGYEHFILNLHNQLHNDKKTAKTLRYLPGFTSKNDFRKLIDQETTRITQKQAQEQALRAKEEKCLITTPASINTLITETTEHINTTQLLEEKSRLTKRVAAARNTLTNTSRQNDYARLVNSTHIPTEYRKDFANCYGTELDQCLHQELCDLFTQTHSFGSSLHKNDFYAQQIIPLIHHYAWQAKVERNITQAFTLSDIAHRMFNVVTQVAAFTTKATCAVAAGLYNGATTVLSPEHWKSMGDGMINLMSCVLNGIKEHDELDRALLPPDPNEYKKVIERYHHIHEQRLQAIQQHYETTLATLKKMSWDEVLSHAVELGTTLILDTVLLNAGSTLVGKAGNSFVLHITEVLRAEQAPACIAEVAGVGKIALEEGMDIIPHIKNAIEGSIAPAPDTSMIAGKSINEITTRTLNFAPRQLQAKFKHAADFGISGNYSNANASEFCKAINRHINTLETKIINGTYKGLPAIHYLDIRTGLNVITHPNGQFWSGWRLSSEQLKHLFTHGALR